MEIAPGVSQGLEPQGFHGNSPDASRKLTLILPSDFIVS
jgi:hypothetical protein